MRDHLPTPTVDPFAHMRRAIGSMSAAAATGVLPRRGRPTKVDGAMGKTDILRNALAEGGRMRSEHLAPIAGIEVTTVSALLRRDVLKGRIQCQDGWYSLNADFDRAQLKELSAATRLLRRHGFIVTKKAPSMTATRLDLQSELEDNSASYAALDAALRAALQGGSLFIDYTNYRCERAVREIRPVTAPYLGSNEYHPQVQWLVNAVDAERDLERTFALRNVHAWASTRDARASTDPA